MRHHNLPSDAHQIIHPYPRPLFPSTHRPQFPRSLQKDPNLLAFFQSAGSSRRVFPVEKDEGEQEIRCCYCGVKEGVLFAEGVFERSVAEKGGFCLGQRGEGEGCVGAKALFGARFVCGSR